MSVRAACGECGSRSTRTIETRRGENGTTMRRRICMECGHKFTTREQSMSSCQTAKQNA